MASLAASMLAGHIGLAFDLGLGVNASAAARRPCQLRGAWLQTRSGRRVQELPPGTADYEDKVAYAGARKNGEKVFTSCYFLCRAGGEW